MPAVATPVPATPAAPFQVTDGQVRHFVDQGYLVVEGLVSPAEVEALRQDTVAIARGAYPCPSITPVDPRLSDQEVLEHLLCIHMAHHISPVMRAVITHPGIAAVLRKIVAAHLPHWDGSVKCMQSMLFVKPPGKQGQAWHQDEVYIPTRDRSLCGAWIALDAATRANGCLSVIPGSHRSGYLYPQRAHQHPAEFDFAPESYGFDEREEVFVEVPAGAVVFFNGYLLHRSRRNRSGTYRRALVNHFMNAWSLLPWGKIEEHAAIADCRAIIPVCGTDPYAWKGIPPLGDNVWLRTYDRDAAAQADAAPA